MNRVYQDGPTRRLCVWSSALGDYHHCWIAGGPTHYFGYAGCSGCSGCSADCLGLCNFASVVPTIPEAAQRGSSVAATITCFSCCAVPLDRVAARDDAAMLVGRTPPGRRLRVGRANPRCGHVRRRHWSSASFLSDLAGRWRAASPTHPRGYDMR